MQSLNGRHEPRRKFERLRLFARPSLDAEYARRVNGDSQRRVALFGPSHRLIYLLH